MKLRKLEQKDAPYMLEWMHNITVVEFLQTDFSLKTMRDCEIFVKESQQDQRNLHMAIVDDFDMYMGTVSLKNIIDGTAEFAITIRKGAMGSGYSSYGMSEILRLGWEELHLNCIYWYVAPENKRAIRFYDKRGYKGLNTQTKEFLEYKYIFKEMGGYSEDKINRFLWYIVYKPID